jgi:hypothetical protein
MKRILFAVALAIGGTLAAGALAAGDRGSGTLTLKARFPVPNDLVKCPSDAPQGVDCYLFVVDAVVAGLGHITTTYTRTFDGNLTSPCVRTLPTADINVAGKGEILAEITGPECAALPPVGLSFDYAINGGSGAYTGASGTIHVKSLVPTTGPATDTWTGALTVPGLEFDVTPPIFAGATPKTVKVPKGAMRVRVRYIVKAKDAVDGSRSVSCTPRSGSFFKLGRSTVTCSAEDSSGNTAQTRFAITVKRS